MEDALSGRPLPEIKGNTRSFPRSTGSRLLRNRRNQRPLEETPAMLHLAGTHVALNPLSSTSLLASLGALGVFLALFAETGLLIGFFLPGDSLLFTAVLLCSGSSSSQAHLSLPPALLSAAGRARIGGPTGFVIGRRAAARS